MSQANEKIIWPETFTAGGDLSDKQYYGVKLSGDRTTVIMAADTDRPVGVVVNAPESGQEAQVCVIGRCPVVLSDTLVSGDPIYFHSDGTVKKFTPGTDITKYCAGQITKGGATGETGEALIQCANPVKGAASA